MLGKKALQTTINAGQDVNDGQNLRQSVKERGEQTLGLNSPNSSQSGAGRKGPKRKARPRSNSSPSGKKAKTFLYRRRNLQVNFICYRLSKSEYKWLLLSTSPKSARDLNSTIPATQTSISKRQWIEHHL